METIPFFLHHTRYLRYAYKLKAPVHVQDFDRKSMRTGEQHDKENQTGFFYGMIASIGGTVLAMNAQSIAFMNVKSSPTPRSGTSYAVQEHILQQIGLLLLAFGLLLTLMVYREYLRAPSSDD